MSNFCPHCGTAVSENNSKNCLSCGKPLSDRSETSKNDSLNESKEKLFNFAKNVKELSIKASEDLRSEETKAKLKDFANQAQSFASEKTKDLKDELNKINEARKATANEAKDLKSASKLENSKVIAQSFWSKLTNKQKVIFASIPLIFAVLFLALQDQSDNIWTADEYRGIAMGIIYSDRELIMSNISGTENTAKYLKCVTRGIKSKYSGKELREANKNILGNFIIETKLKCSKNSNLYMNVSPPIGMDKTEWYGTN